MFDQKQCLYFTLFLICGLHLLITTAQAACVCNEKGSDHCAACSERLVVRPKQRPYDANPDIDLSPIGDNCWCSKQHIEPASLPKTCKKHKKPSCGCKGYGPSSSSSESIFSSSSSHAYAGGSHVNYVSTQPKDDSVAADPISVSLAIQAGRAIEVPEAKLAYGFVQKPIDGLPKVFMSSVKEEKLYGLNSDVITLKKRISGASKKPEEDYPEPEEEPADAQNDEDEQPRLTYKQLGYVAEQYKNPAFQEVSSSYVSAYGKPEPSVVPGKVYVDCGYKPGRIAPFNKVKNYGNIDNCYEKS